MPNDNCSDSLWRTKYRYNKAQMIHLYTSSTQEKIHYFNYSAIKDNSVRVIPHWYVILSPMDKIHPFDKIVVARRPELVNQRSSDRALTYPPNISPGSFQPPEDIRARLSLTNG